MTIELDQAMMVAGSVGLVVLLTVLERRSQRAIRLRYRSFLERNATHLGLTIIPGESDKALYQRIETELARLLDELPDGGGS